MQIIIMGLLALLCVLFVVEHRINVRCLRAFKAVVHVNGIRGKSGTCRLIDAALREQYRVFTKTTGTDARTIDVAGLGAVLRRWGAPKISEQLSVIRRAKREGAEVLVLECMAVRPELQIVSQREIARAKYGVITNVRHDHALEMGASLDEIAEPLSGTIPENGVLFTADAEFYPFFSKKCAGRNTRCVLCDEDPPGRENESIARAVAHELGLTDEQIDRGFAKVQRDFGARRTYALGKGEFLNLFSCNDPDSALMQLSDIGGAPVFVYNHRWDRPDRVQLFAERFFPHYPGATVLLLGGSPLVKRLLIKGEPTLTLRTLRRWTEVKSLSGAPLVVGLGNIKGGAHDMIEWLESEANRS